MSEQAVVTDADGKSREQIKAKEEHQINLARPKPKTEQATYMQTHDQKALDPVQSHAVGWGASRQGCTDHFLLVQIMFAELRL